jgi:hypothetical protein
VVIIYHNYNAGYNSNESKYNIISKDDLKRAARQISIYHMVRAEKTLDPVREFSKDIDGHNAGTMGKLAGTWEDKG